MPKSKRDKKISLTQTKKKGLELKQGLVQEIQNCVDKYARIFLFSVQNMRNSKLKDVRTEWKHSRFFFGKNKVMALALGRTAEDEYRDDLHLLSKRLRGQMGLLFTNQSKKEVLEWFKEFRDKDYARSGNVATQTVVIDQGPLSKFSHSMEPQLRQLGLATKLVKGVITLTSDHTVCEQGDILTPEQCRILKLFGHLMADFYISVEAMWSNNGTFEEFSDTQDHIVPPKIRLKPKQTTDEDDDGLMVEVVPENEEMTDDDDEEEDQ
ncbi:mRNA turnover protein 4 homolog [Lingula anatina]|uniref:Ribosome assembly factor mrt4 n=1 Tax=Lingula anatina TaxID=7574 RepID=A0A1S3HBR7_LINAN|nr:mRNA turnover protein 4 homolog [Lingula anatina]|eukprot:XP_013383453.1 mRNA turnover protein 4 homolog [Lingula anatina]